MAPETIAGGAAEGSAAEGSGGGGLGLDAHREQLLADIPDDVTLAEIVPKLRWKCLEKLASVSPAWLHAVRSREIYNARAKCGALESLVIIRTFPVDNPSNHMLYLHSTRDGFYLELPPLPVCEHGIPFQCQCVTLDGVIYVLGGRELGFCLVYKLDLAGPRQWKRCAKMLRWKSLFSCAALGGKIYVVESIESESKTLLFSEVYDPKADTWCVIEPLPVSPRGGAIIALGEELIRYSQQPMAALEFAYLADVYNPAKDEWRVETFYSDEADESHSDEADESDAVFFAAEGKLHWVSDGCISVLDMDTKRWTLRHSYVLSGLGPHHALGDSGSFGGVLRQPDFVLAVTAVGDEVLALVGRHDLEAEDSFFQSEGFGGKDINIDFTRRDCKVFPSEPDDPNWRTIWKLPAQTHLMYPIKL